MKLQNEVDKMMVEKTQLEDTEILVKEHLKRLNDFLSLTPPQIKEASEAAKEALEAAKELAFDNKTPAQYHTLAQSFKQNADKLYFTDAFSESLPMYQRALELANPQEKSFITSVHLDCTETFFNLNPPQIKKATESSKQALESAIELVVDNGSPDQYHTLAQFFKQGGDELYIRDAFSESLPMYQRALELANPQEKNFIATVHLDSAKAFLKIDRDQTKEARESSKQALESAIELVVDNGSPDQYHTLAQSFKQGGDELYTRDAFSESLLMYQRALELANPQEKSFITSVHLYRTEAFLDLNPPQIKEAIESSQRALESSKKLVVDIGSPDQYHKLAQSFQQLARFLYNNDAFSESLPMYQRALELANPQEKSFITRVHLYRAKAFLKLDPPQIKEATESSKQALGSAKELDFDNKAPSQHKKLSEYFNRTSNMLYTYENSGTTIASDLFTKGMALVSLGQQKKLFWEAVAEKKKTFIIAALNVFYNSAAEFELNTRLLPMNDPEITTYCSLLEFNKKFSALPPKLLVDNIKTLELEQQRKKILAPFKAVAYILKNPILPMRSMCDAGDIITRMTLNVSDAPMMSRKCILYAFNQHSTKNFIPEWLAKLCNLALIHFKREHPKEMTDNELGARSRYLQSILKERIFEKIETDGEIKEISTRRLTKTFRILLYKAMEQLAKKNEYPVDTNLKKVVDAALQKTFDIERNFEKLIEGIAKKCWEKSKLQLLDQHCYSLKLCFSTLFSEKYSESLILDEVYFEKQFSGIIETCSNFLVESFNQAKNSENTRLLSSSSSSSSVKQDKEQKEGVKLHLTLYCGNAVQPLKGQKVALPLSKIEAWIDECCATNLKTREDQPQTETQQKTSYSKEAVKKRKFVETTAAPSSSSSSTSPGTKKPKIK